MSAKLSHSIRTYKAQVKKAVGIISKVFGIMVKGKLFSTSLVRKPAFTGLYTDFASLSPSKNIKLILLVLWSIVPFIYLSPPGTTKNQTYSY